MPKKGEALEPGTMAFTPAVALTWLRTVLGGSCQARLQGCIRVDKGFWRGFRV